LNNNSEIIIGNNVGATGTTIVAVTKVSIGNNVMIGAHSIIVDTDFHHPDPNIRLRNDVMPSRPVIIEDDVFIGYNCLILKGVTIGKNSVIGANSVVINSIPKNSIAIGNPCKVIIRKNWEE
jgi:acetyltransferase-like isoleucine patch superfamily enzyme